MVFYFGVIICGVIECMNECHHQGTVKALISFFMCFHLNDLASPGVLLLPSPHIAWITKVFITLRTESDKGTAFLTLIIKS